MDHKPLPNLSRRKALAALGVGGALLASRGLARAGGEAPSAPRLKTCFSATELGDLPETREGDWVETAGFHRPGDGGAALYRIASPGGEEPDGAGVIGLENGLRAVLEEGEAVNYRMFGAVGDGENDDGVQIKLAHEYAIRRGLPVVNLSGEYWIKESNGIPIQTNVHWGTSVFHLDERFNQRTVPRFAVLNDEPRQTIEWDGETKAAVLAKLKPGVQIIPEFAPWAGCLVSVVDAGDRIGLRAGARFAGQGWSREELFYVEEEGRIIGDIAWGFSDFTSVTAIPCNRNFLVIDGGGFLYSGDDPDDTRSGYYHNGIFVRRSRTIIRNQWMGLEPGRRDDSMRPRRGHYVLTHVYDVTLENIRAMPWEQNRADESRRVGAGTYGIGGGRMLNCTFRNLTAEAGWVAWGIFGTNINKNFRLENCRLNRVDVHFHCWNLHIRDCVVGFRGIAVTGGGDLIIENTTRHGNHFINFRRDFGSRWDGHIRLRNCTLRPNTNAVCAVLQHRMADFDYQYPIGYARSVKVEDLVVDFSAVPDSRAVCWLIDTVSMSQTSDGTRLFFPTMVEFRNVQVEGRRQGVRLMKIENPGGFDTGRSGSEDGSFFEPNSTLLFDRVQLEQRVPRNPGDREAAHFQLGGGEEQPYADNRALYPRIEFTGCDNLNLWIGRCAADVSVRGGSLAFLSASGLRGGLSLADCHLRPESGEAADSLWSVEATHGVRFTNCTLHAPLVAGRADAGAVNRLGILRINGPVRHAHLNTSLANDLVARLRENGEPPAPAFIAKLKARHGLEDD